MNSETPQDDSFQQQPDFRDGEARSIENSTLGGEDTNSVSSEFTSHEATDPTTPTQRRILLPLILFAFTCLSTFWSGSVGLYGIVAFSGIGNFFDVLVMASWWDGLTYMAAMMSILLAHEMGHFLMTLRHRIPASLPFFIPMPLTLIGTMGAVIALHGSKADRKQLFDIGIAGPLAGLVIAVPVLCAGIYLAQPDDTSLFSQPLISKLLISVIRPDLTGKSLGMNPLLMAGWVGLLLTGLNMMPISQLDGGHVAYALFRRNAHRLAQAFLIVAIAFVVYSGQTVWVLMLSLVVLIGIYHPPTADDNVRMGAARTFLGYISLALPILCFPPYLINFD